MMTGPITFHGNGNSWERKREILHEFSGMNPQGSVVICGGESMLDLKD